MVDRFLVSASFVFAVIPHYVMTKKWIKLLDRLEKRAGEIVSLKAALAPEKEQSAQYYKWWQEEETKVKELEDCIEAGNEAAGLNVVEKPNE